ncbi:MAG: LUD domain-containing protein [Ferruginibacter sp.]|nr:LUD domain-containing protein [Ferruginibacter sp.]
MMATTAKENILNRIKEALLNPVPLPFTDSNADADIFVKNNDDNIVLFSEEFTKLQGKFLFCISEQEFQEKLAALILENNWQKIFCIEDKINNFLKNILVENYTNLSSCDVSITGCESLVARTGTMVLSAAQQSGRTTSVYAPIHICVAYTSQMIYDVKDALASLTDKYQTINFPSFITFASGPSRTADIEKTLVTGVHGPKEVYCFLVEDTK